MNLNLRVAVQTTDASAPNYWPPSPRLSEMKFNSEKTTSLFKNIDIFFALLDTENTGEVTRSQVHQKLQHCFEVISGSKLEARALAKKQIIWLFASTTPQEQQFGQRASLLDSLTKDQFVHVYRRALNARVESEILEMDVLKGIRAIKQLPHKELFSIYRQIYQLLADNEGSHLNIEPCEAVLTCATKSASTAAADSEAVQAALSVLKGSSERRKLTREEYSNAFLSLIEAGVSKDTLLADAETALVLAQESAEEIKQQNQHITEPEKGNVHDIQAERKGD